MANIDQPWTSRRTARDSDEFYVVDKTGTSFEVAVDERSSLIKTPRSRFRSPTPYSRTISTGSQRTVPVSAYQTFKSGGYTYEQWFTGHTNTHDPGLPVVPQSVVDWTVARCLRKLKDQKVNLAQAFAERKQTARLVTSNLIKVAKVGRALRHLDLAGASRALGVRRPSGRIRPESVTDFWLELQYGWKPALSDIHGAMEALQERESKSEVYKACVTAARTVKERLLFGPYLRYPLCDTGSTTFSGRFWYEARYEDTYSAFTRLDYVRDFSVSTDTLSELGFTNPLSLAWEVLPFSFVVDWSLPIGEYFNLFDADHGWSFKGGSTSTRAVRKGFHTVTGIQVQGLQNESGYAYGSGRGRRVNFDRIVRSAAPFVPLPSIDTRSSNLHVANGLALLSSAFLAKSIKLR